MARNYTLAEIKTLVRQRADMENSQFVSDSELTYYINLAAAELHDLLINTFNDYNVTCRTIALSSDQDVYQLPEDFYNIYRVEVSTDGSFNTNTIKLKKFSFQDWNRSTNSVGMGVTGFLYTQYRVVGDNLILMPKPSGAGYARIWYYPPAKKLKDLSTNVDKPNGYSYSFTDADVDTIKDTITVADHNYFVGDRVSFSSVGGGLPTPIPSGLDLYAIPINKDEFRIAETVQNAFDNIYYDITSAASGGTYYINDDLNIYNGQNGWEEYIIVDASIRCKTKEDLDTSALMAAKMALIRRVLDSGKNRDASEPDAIRDSQAQSYGFFTNGNVWP